MKTTTLLLAALFLVTACSTTPEKEGSETLLFNPVITTNALEVSVMSHGCTKAEHFYLRVDEQTIELRRTEADLCRRAPMLVRLNFDYPFAQDVYHFKNQVRFSNRINRR